MSRVSQLLTARPTRDDVSTIITNNFIRESLAIYEEQHIYLEHVDWNLEEFLGRFRLSHYPFTKSEYIDYLTAPMLFLYLSQLGYVMARIISQHYQTRSGICITDEEFFSIRDHGGVMITSVSKLKFRRKVFIRDKSLDIQGFIDRIVTSRRGVFSAITFCTPQEEISGQFSAVISLA